MITFLVDSDFQISASKLDNKRLGKQRVEALQILNLIRDIKFLSNYFDIHISTDSRDEFRNSIKMLIKYYKSKSYKFVCSNREYTKISKDHKTIKIKPSQKYIISDNEIIIYNSKIRKVYNKDDVKLPTERVVSLGHVYHPIVYMWFNYTKALKLYINAHITEWMNRDYTNSMQIYEFQNLNTTYPDFVYNQEFHKRHKASLLNKEQLRKEKDWYVHFDDFVESMPFTDYIWNE